MTSCLPPETTLSSLADAIAAQGVKIRLVGPDRPVRGMSIDSRAVSPEALFACKGAAFKPAYLEDALNAGATAYLCDESSEPDLSAHAEGVSHLVTDDIRPAMAYAARAAYGRPDKRIDIMGITGTKGKSTTSFLLKSIFAAAGMRPSIIGSIETDDGIDAFESHNTTPEAVDLWRHVFNTAESGRKHLVMEVSSHALKYDRTLGLMLDVACFLNIGRDHISPSEHPSFEDYFASKLRIFDQCRTAVVNLDSDLVDEVLEHARRAERLLTFGVDRPEADYSARDVRPCRDGIAFDLACEGGTRLMTLGMAGLFNAENALAAIAMARIAGIGFEDIASGLAHVRVPGRMEVVRSAAGSTIALVDYAHNELSYKTFFTSVRKEHPAAKVVAVFGAPGDKAFERREVLPRVAAQFADYLIYTEEDPAHEDPRAIAEELAANTPADTPCEIIVDREQAIIRAFEVAGENDAVVCLLAKGDETRQHRGDSFPEVKSDLHIARECLGVAQDA
ncbi:Mur ligase family protein [Slackia exigua]